MTVLSLLGLSIGLVAAGISASKSVFTKLATRRTDSLFVTLFSRTAGFTLLLPFTLFLLLDSSIPTNDDFLIAVFVGGTILAFMSYLVTLALEKSDLSIVSPLLSLVPVAVILPSIIIVGETPTAGAGIGVGLISVGSYLLNIGKRSKGLLKPIESIFEDRGAQFTLLAVLLFAVVPSLNKLALDTVSPIVLTTFQLPVSAMVLCIVGLRRIPELSEEINGNLKYLLAMSITTALLFVVQFTGYQYAQVSYIQAIKQVKVVIAVGAGYYIFNEDGLKERLSGGIVMVIGAILVLVLS